MIEVTTISVCSVLVTVHLRGTLAKIVRVFSAGPGLKHLACTLSVVPPSTGLTHGCLYASFAILLLLNKLFCSLELFKNEILRHLISFV